MSNADLRRKPHEFKYTNTMWWYETTRGIEIIRRGNVVKTVIPWKTIRAALARKDKKGDD